MKNQYVFKVSSFDNNDEHCEITVTATTRESALNIANNARRLLREEGTLNGGSELEELVGSAELICVK